MEATPARSDAAGPASAARVRRDCHVVADPSDVAHLRMAQSPAMSNTWMSPLDTVAGKVTLATVLPALNVASNENR